MDVSKNRGKTPQNGWFIWWKTLFFNGWFGGTIIFGNTNFVQFPQPHFFIIISRVDFLIEKKWKGELNKMGVSKNTGTPKSSILIGFLYYKPSILGVFRLFLETPKSPMPTTLPQNKKHIAGPPPSLMHGNPTVGPPGENLTVKIHIYETPLRRKRGSIFHYQQKS